jgi:hypothetical protein
MQFGIAQREYNFEILSCALRQEFVTSLSIKAADAGIVFRFCISQRRMDRARMCRAGIVARIIRKKLVGMRHAKAQS